MGPMGHKLITTGFAGLDIGRVQIVNIFGDVIADLIAAVLWIMLDYPSGTLKIIDDASLVCFVHYFERNPIPSASQSNNRM